MADKREYLFDVKFFASVRVKATDEAAARKTLDDLLLFAELELWDGEEDRRRVAIDVEGERELTEIDGEEVE